MKFLLLFSCCLLVNACTSYPHSAGRDQYNQQIESHSAGDKQFSGLYHKFEFRATLLTEAVSQAIYNRMKRFYDWNDQEAEEKYNKRMSQLETSTKVWLSFFTSESKNDNLANKNSIWKIYLYVDGQRYEGRAKKANKNLEEAIALFSYHSRWSTAYYVEFPVPTQNVDRASVRLAITGPMGRREVSFPES